MEGVQDPGATSVSSVLFHVCLTPHSERQCCKEGMSGGQFPVEINRARFIKAYPGQQLTPLQQSQAQKRKAFISSNNVTGSVATALTSDGNNFDWQHSSWLLNPVVRKLSSMHTITQKAPCCGLLMALCCSTTCHTTILTPYSCLPKFALLLRSQAFTASSAG